MANHNSDSDFTFSDSHSPTATVPAVVQPEGSTSQALVAPGMYGPQGLHPTSFPPRGPEILSSGFDQKWLFHCLRRRWLMALLMGLLVGGAAAGLLLWLFPESSSIVAYLQVKSKPPQTLDISQQQRLTPKDFEVFQQTQLTLLKGQFVLASALSKPEIAQLDAVVKEPDPILWLYEDLRVSFPGEGEILEVRYDGEEKPAEMMKIVDAVIAAYQHEVLDEERIKSNNTRNELRKLHTKVEDELKDQLEKFTALAESYGGSDSATSENDIRVLMADLNLLQHELNDAKKEQVDIEVMKALALGEARSVSALESAVQLELQADPMLAHYQEQQFLIDRQIADLESTSRRANSPQLKQLRQTRYKSEQDLQEFRRNKEREIRERLKQAPNDMLSRVMAEYALRKQANVEKLAELEQSQETKLEQLKQRGAYSPMLDMMKQEIEQTKEVEQSIAIRLRSWDIEADANDDRIKVVQPATSSENINTIQRFTIAGVGGLAAFCLTCYGIAMMEFGRRRLNGPDQVDEGLGIRVLGSLPSVSARKAMGAGSAVAAQLSESIDNVRATLMHDSTSRKRQVILISSPVTMEGSTTVASHLALSLTRAGRRTLLVDGDVREPSLHKLFGMPLGDGLCEVLRSETDVTDAIRATNTEGLWLLTAGQCDMDAVHALATDQPQPIVDKLRDEFDFIVIDGAPILGLSDTLSLGQYVDGAILTVLRDHSEIRKVYQAAELLKSLGIRLIGTVVNGVPIKADRRVTRLHRLAAKQPKKLPAEAASS